MAKRRGSDSGEDSACPDSGQPTFEESLARLEEITERLEEGQLGLGESLACYEEGIKHLKQCYELLERAERKIELLSGIDAQGNPITEPFDDAASTLDETAKTRGRRRSTPEKPPTIDTAKAADDIDDGGLLF